MKRLLLLALLPAAFAQSPSLRDNRDTQLDCGRMSQCEIRDQVVASTGRFSVVGVHNGDVTVRGWARSDVRVRVKVSTGGPNSRLRDIRTPVSPGRLSIDMPDNSFFGWIFGVSWSVSTEIFVPHNTDLTTEAHNGRIVVTDIAGRVEARSHNGGTRMERISGDVRATSHNGSMSLELTGEPKDTRRVEMENHNGSIAIAMPRGFSASVTSEAHNGSVRSDFPSYSRVGNRGRGDQDFTIGSGGLRLRLRTHNGSIRLREL